MAQNNFTSGAISCTMSKISGSLTASGFDLGNPKNIVQYYLYKMELAMQECGDAIANLIDELAAAINTLIPAVVEAYKKIIAKTCFNRIAFLAYHAKKARTRKKNKARLFRLMRALFRPGENEKPQKKYLTANRRTIYELL